MEDVKIMRLRTKFFIVYTCLAIITAIIAVFSSINIYNLSKSINGLMVHNYKSINAVKNMNAELYNENNSILIYLNKNKNEGISSFNSSKDVFQKWYQIEANNISETDEGNLVDTLNRYHKNYLELFDNIQQISEINGLIPSLKFYDNSIIPTSVNITKILNDISLLNENAMFNGKDNVTKYAVSSMYIIIIVSTLLIILGFFIAIFTLDKFLYPIYSLRETMKAVKDGDLKSLAPILSKDEIGELTTEFNNMAKRLRKFEESTLGKLLEEKIKSSAIVMSISDPLIVLDTDYKIVLLNNACEYFFNIKEKESLNKNFLDIIKNDDLYEYISKICNFKEKEVNPKITYINSNNRDNYFNVIVNILKDPENKISGLVVLLQDVTELKQLENMKSDFIGTISHEFKTPLTSIMFGTSLMRDKKIGNLNQKQFELINEISENSDRLLALVNDLLYMSKIESNESIFNIESQEIDSIIEKSVKTFYEQAKSKSVYLQYDYHEKFPKVKVDSEKVVWVINNLISNALKYSKIGSEIIISTALKLDVICVFVTDNGTGIPEEYQELIFNKFVQVKGYDSEINGTGLGLAISKEIIVALGGEIWCESKLGEWSRFTFTLPIDK